MSVCMQSTQVKKKGSWDKVIAGVLKARRAEGVPALASFATERGLFRRGNPNLGFLSISSQRSRRELSSCACTPEDYGVVLD